jgi:ribose transport system substrate-binding protein
MIRTSNLIGLLLATAISIVGCGKNDQSSTGGGATTQASAGGGGDITIAVIPKGTTHAYWKTVHAGAEAAAKDLGVTIDWKGPVKENDRSDQIAMVQQFVGQGVQGIVVAPLDFEGLAAPVADATGKGIPVVIIDSAVKGTAGKDFVSFVATNNHQAGALGGENLAKLLGEKGKVVLLRYVPGSASTDERESGFLEAIAKYPNITVISKDQYGGATQGESKDKSLQMLDKLQEADGIFCPNESSTLGMLGALDQAGLVGKKKFVGFDATPPLVDALRAKQIDVLVAQNPRKMGYEGVKACVSAIRKQPVEQQIDTGTAVITLANIDDPEIKKVLGE